MKKNIKLLAVLTFLLSGYLNAQENTDTASFQGKWIRLDHSGPVALTFKSDGKAEVDFGNDQNVDVVTGFETDENTIRFSDKAGAMCARPGTYKFEKNDYYLSFDLVEDMCNGRIKMTMGFWTKPNFEELLKKISQRISDTESPNLYLMRARIYMAMGKSKEAKADLDFYLEKNPDDARALINRAGTRFPFPEQMESAVDDCDRAILLEPENKNAYFMRGLAHYNLDQKEKACEDFSKAIDLGFSILRIAEKQRCDEFWGKK